MNQRSAAIVALLLFAAAATGFFVARFTQDGRSTSLAETDVAERAVAYWVAPMDPNFRSDTPGKSPMGMDLIPVYVDAEMDVDDNSQSLKINPSVVNNIGIRTEPVIRTDLSRTIRTVGNVMADEELRSDVHIRSEGWIEKLAVKSEGELVSEGDLLFQIYSPSLVAAQSEYLQTLRLSNRALVAAAGDRLTALGMSEGQVGQVRSSGEIMQLISVYAPQSGVVMSLNVREGMFVQPSNTIMSLADLAEIWVLADVFETEVDWLAPGQKSSMTLPAFPGEKWEGEIGYVYPTVDLPTRTVRVRLRFSNHDGRLKPNMYANVVLNATPLSDVLAIPQSALIRSSTGDRVVLALGEGRFRPASVVAGIETDGRVQIVAGLEAGERVVTSGQFLIDSEASLDAGLLRLTTPDMLGDHQ
jgi:membrane fusion protein, copper/silver efflux system